MAPDRPTCRATVPKQAQLDPSQEAPSSVPDNWVVLENGGHEDKQVADASRILDYFVVAEVLASRVGAIPVLDQALLYPHAPVVLKLRELSQVATIQQQVRFHSFPMGLIGPHQAPQVHPWTWTVGTPVDPYDMMKQ